MNVNDVICVGAEPLAMLDYIAIERADPEICEQIGVGLARGAELAGIEIPGGELAQLGEMVRGVRPRRRLLRHASRLDAIIDGSRARAGRLGDRPALLGTPLQRLHAWPAQRSTGIALR